MWRSPNQTILPIFWKHNYAALNMDYEIRALTAGDELIVWEMLRYASHEPSVEAVQTQPYLARYATNWGRIGELMPLLI